MGTNPFKPADRESVKARIGLTGPSGSGKTHTALMLANNLGNRVAGIDTERGRMLEFQRRFKFDHFAPDRFDPRSIPGLVAQAAEAAYDVLVLDSWTHYWSGTGGALEFVDNNTKPGGSKFSSGWREYGPIENAMLEALMTFPGHVIITMRAKMAYVVETMPDGKQAPKKIGLKPEQRDGAEYEFSIFGELDQAHTLTISKSTCQDLMDGQFARPGPEVAAIIAEWCSDGTPTPTSLELRREVLGLKDDAAGLRRMHATIRQRRMLGAAVMDEGDLPTTLGALVVSLGLAASDKAAEPAGQLVGAAAN